MTPHDHFADWLHEHSISIALTLPSHRSVVVSMKNGGVVLSEAKDEAISVAEPEPRDIASISAGRIFVSPRYSCIAKVYNGASIAPVWKPYFISDIKPEDRCHLNGMAMRAGAPAYVTAFAETDTKSGWRIRPDGIVIDFESGEVICRGLSMPHSPRLHRGKLWLLNSGNGEIGFVEADRFHPVARCPGFLRGLAFVGDYALIGSSIPRSPFFTGLPMHLRTAAASRCGIYVLNTRSAEVEHSLHFDRAYEMYEISTTNKTGDETTLQH